MARGHQGCNRPQAAAAALVAAHPKKDVVEEVESIRSALKQTQALGGSFGVEDVLGGVVGRTIFKPRNGRPKVMNQMIVLAHDQPIHQP